MEEILRALDEIENDLDGYWLEDNPSTANSTMRCLTKSLRLAVEELAKIASNENFLQLRQEEIELSSIVTWTKDSAKYMFTKAWNLKRDMAETPLPRSRR